MKFKLNLVLFLPLGSAFFPELLFNLINLLTINCVKNEFNCGTENYINITKLCDGKINCLNWSDEEKCDLFNCKPPNYYRCHNGTCVTSSHLCNNINDCADGDDESNCQAKLINTSICSNDQYVCPSGECISRNWVCDGFHNCKDGSDETLDCKTKSKCEENQFMCLNRKCIFRIQICNQHDDCGDNSDESHCHRLPIDLTNYTINNRKFPCEDKLKCIDIRKICNNKSDCYDQSDEKEFCLEMKKNHECANCDYECVITESGIFYLCTLGYKPNDNFSCEDINECETYGICDQYCTNTPGSYYCSCDYNYSLQSDKHTCKIKDGQVMLLYSATDKIKGIFLENHHQFTFVNNTFSAGIAAFEENIYWTVIKERHEAIVRVKKNEHDREMIITCGLGKPENLAIDWITSNIYFTDAYYRYIGVCTNDGYSCTVLHSEDIDKPRDIALSPQHGLMFWTDWGLKPLIGRSSMDGSSSIVFVTDDIIWPNGVTIDVPAERLYWVDAKKGKIETMKFDKTDRRTILEEMMHPFSIAVFENKLYWSDLKGKQILSCNKFTGEDRQILVWDPINRIHGLHIHHHLLHPTEIDNPCKKSPCSDICLLSPTGSKLHYSCACSVGKKLMTNGVECQINNTPITLIAGFQNRLYIIEYNFLGREKIKEIQLEVSSISAIAYNNVADVVLISDTVQNSIFSFNLSSRMLSPVITHGLSHIRDIHYDEFGNNLYWCDWNSLTVDVMSLLTLARTTLISGTSVEIPIDIALIPEHGFMFVAFSVYSSYVRIDRVSMDGKFYSKIQFVDVNLQGSQVRLHFDNETKQLFWANFNTNEIESISIMGGDIQSYDKTSSPVSLISAGGKLFWTSSQSSKIHEMDLQKKTYSDNLVLNIGASDTEEIELTAITKSARILSSCHIKNGGCSHLCLVSHETPDKIICACPSGYSLSTDNFTCLKPKLCSLKEYQCYTGECIPVYRVCDKHEDCPHGDDEFVEHCDIPRCPTEQFLCSDRKKCINLKEKCNGHYDCDDRSDEICNVNCTNGKFWCDSGECIDRRFRCDGKIDCKDARDELNCSQAVCDKDDFRCKSGQCIPIEWECDKEPDCIDGTDEYDSCHQTYCSSTEFRCRNEKCVNVSQMCDGNDDCGDRSDEFHCENYEHVYQICNSQIEFYCATNERRCLPISVRCNGTVECSNGADERNCDTNPCIKGEEFYCRKEKKCIPLEWLCDRSNDCGDNSDELSQECINKKINQKICHGFECINGECISLKKVCNHIFDCSDKSDEGGKCDDSCEKFGCNQKCYQMPTGAHCTCRNGYELSSDNKTCVDINECNLEICAQTCTNELGNFKCDCYSPAFTLQSDRISCKANGESKKFVATSGKDLMIITNNLKNKHNINMGTQLFASIIGLDADVHDNFYVLLENENLYKVNAVNSLKYNQLNLLQSTSFAYDWITEKIFLIKSHTCIIVTLFNSSKNITLYKTSNQFLMWTLSIDPVAGYLFWFESIMESDFSSSGIIKRSDCNGDNVQNLITSLSYDIRQLVIDSFSRHIFWIDKDQIIHRMCYDGSDIRDIVKSSEEIVTFTFFENSLYWVIRGAIPLQIKKCKIYGLQPRKCEMIKFNMNSIEHFVVMQSNRQRIVPNPCDKIDCIGICVSTPSGSKCLCDSDSLEYNSCHNSAEKKSEKSIFGNYVAFFIIICFILSILVIVYSHFCRPKSKILHRLHFHNPVYGMSKTPACDVINQENGLNPKDPCSENSFCQQMNALQQNELLGRKCSTLHLESVQEENIDIDYNLNDYHSVKESLIKKGNCIK